MEHKIVGTTMPVLEVSLAPGESVVAEGGELSWMTGSVDLHTAASGKAGGKGMLGSLKRSIAGGTFFMTEYTAQGGPGMVAFATKVPGHIKEIDLDGSRQYMVHRHGYLCGTPDVALEIGFQQKLSAGFFGGEGFILQRVSGTGTGWVELDGEVVEYDLGPGETMKVHPGHVGLFDASISFEIERVKGIKNIMFGADSLFLAKLTGPGTVFLQTMPIANLAAAIAPYLGNGDSGNGGGTKFSIGGLSFGTDS
ncbi:MAG TPA: AIM24 family protein [Acidimicrobiia bacterium]|jgi:uncharacterized protein (TIGR00266 family)